MKTIFKSFINGDSKEKLAILADIMSIAGISLGTIVASIFTLEKLNINNVIGVTIISLAGLAIYCIYISSFILLLAKIFLKPWKIPPSVQFLAKCFCWLVFICGALLIGMTIYEFVYGFRIFV
ncbi:TPA: hypothetical protein ACTW52_000057 [Klebsiella quasipneumoniae subsp. similipneumoniae]|uniref:hypothetical protein n=1 Tax=Klebsiella quasipneumoniae TaxID=1463165 RepID=UPI00223220F2|nr:hypothetical protein [Klebsiella quasipneumoniae]MEB5580695.1 hypothetical protein [Klebsiella quasipneumoniae]MEB5745411.1 hypothetical protein [Klebsiella quasipneumoniae]HCI8788205.1 hypothetical protein [Klebsiella quasipneumoniae]